MLESHLGREEARRRFFDSRIAIQSFRISKCIDVFATIKILLGYIGVYGH